MTKILGLVLVGLFSFVGPSWGMGGKDKHISMSFHLQGEETDGPRMVLTVDGVEGKRAYQRMPFLTIEDYESFRPFVAKDGKGFGVELNLKKPSAERARAMTAMNIGKTVLPTVNGRFMRTMKITGPLAADNKIVIWSGVTPEDIENLKKDIEEVEAKKKPLPDLKR